MGNKNNQEQVNKERSLLYELALNTGVSLEIDKSCDLFLKSLLGKKNIPYSAVLIKQILLTGVEESLAKVIYSYPASYTCTSSISLKDALFSRADQFGYAICSLEDYPLEVLLGRSIPHKGNLVVVALDGAGYLILISRDRKEEIKGFLKQLEPVISKFAVNLQACLLQDHLQETLREREQKARKLKIYQERFSRAQLFAKMGTWEFDLETKRLDWSSECARLFGIEEREFGGTFTAFLDYVHPDDRRKVIRENRPILNNKIKKKLSYEHRIIRKDGLMRWVRNEAGPVKNEEGEVYKITGMIIDITRQKNAEEQNRVLLEEKEMLLDNIEEQVWYLIDWETYGMVNAAHAAFLGVRKEELNYKSLWDVFKSAPIIRETIKGNKEVFTTGEKVQNEEWVFNGRGEKRLLSITKAPKLDSRGIVRYVICSARDITEEREMEAELRETNSRLKGILESQEDLIVRVDREGKFLYVNDAYCRKFGKKREELLGSSFVPLIHEEDVESTLRAMQNLYRPPYRVYFEQRAITVQGWRWIGWEDSSILDEQGNVVEIQGVGRDITDRKKAEEELQKSEERLNTLIKNTPAVIYNYEIKDDIPCINYVNENVKNILGFEPEKFINNFNLWKECIHPEDRKRTIDASLEPAGEAEPRILEYRFKDCWGNYRWLHDKQRLIINDDGSREIYGAWWDITERKKLEEELFKSEKYFRSVVEDQTELICRFFPDGTLTFVNPAYCNYFDKSQDELLGRNFLSLLPEEDREIVERNHNFLTVDNPTVTYEHRVVLPDGGVRWQEWVDRALFDDKGQIFEFQAVGRDITEQKNAEMALQEAQAQLEKKVEERTTELLQEIENRKEAEAALAQEKETLRETLQSINEGIVITDTQGTITFVNQEAQEITGRTEVEVKGYSLRVLLQFLVGENKEQTCTDPLSLIMEGRQKNEQQVIETKDGSRKIVFCNGVLIRGRNQEPLFYVVNFKDMTEMKRAEGRLALARKLEAIGRLAAGVAHEINTPMQFIGNNTQFIKSSFAEVQQLWEVYNKLRNDLEQGHYSRGLQRLYKLENQVDIDYNLQEIPRAIEEALAGIDRVKKLVDSMKNLSYSSSKPGVRSKFDLNKAIEDTVNITRNEWKMIADVKVRLDSKIPPIKGNPDEISQVFLNLIVNASHAVQQAVQQGICTRGEITIETRFENREVIAEIDDNGVGIPRAYLSRVFDPFFTTKEVGQGSGQGLTIAYDIIVNQHSGQIEVKSEEGKGTKVRIILPLED